MSRFTPYWGGLPHTQRRVKELETKNYRCALLAAAAYCVGWILFTFTVFNEHAALDWWLAFLWLLMSAPVVLFLTLVFIDLYKSGRLD